MVEKLNIVAKNATHHLQHGKHCMSTKLKVIRTNAMLLITLLEFSLREYSQLKIRFLLVYQGNPRYYESLHTTSQSEVFLLLQQHHRLLLRVFYRIQCIVISLLFLRIYNASFFDILSRQEINP